MTPRLSVVVSSLGNYDGLARVLDGFAAQETPADELEVLVVVDRADPDPGAAQRAIGARPFAVRRLAGAIPGLSANRNAGWQSAAAALVLFTDNDTIPGPRLLAEHLAWHEREPADEVAVLGHVSWSPEVRVTPFMRWLDHGVQFDYPAIDGIEAGWGRFYGANVSVKRAFVERVGGFDAERLPYGYEDLDFAYRARAHGLRLLYNRDAVVDHLREPDLAFYRRRVRRLAYAEREFVRKHPELEPHFRRFFGHAAELEPVSGRGRHLIGWLPRRFPLLGARAWRSADLYYRQELAPDFLAAWAEADAAPASAAPLAPLVGELDPPGSGSGPK